MPPKGWRKDAQGNYPTTSYVKEQENITIHDLLFPKSVITSLAREGGCSVIKSNFDDSTEEKKSIMINKDASLALQRSATVFVNHLLMFARESAREQDRKSCNADDVMTALDQIGLMGFKSIVREKLDDYQFIQTLKQQKKKQQDEEGNKLKDKDSNIGSSNENSNVDNEPNVDDDGEKVSKKPRVDDTPVEL